MLLRRAIYLILKFAIKYLLFWLITRPGLLSNKIRTKQNRNKSTLNTPLNENIVFRNQVSPIVFFLSMQKPLANFDMPYISSNE